ncbi:hypothetical protein CLAFUW4_09822 [Fulvia fulva]|uniref:Aminoglycoside phosphotransferase domain-containing protein n=1 Tax=Passalora fulva TaxID=5499 RepID=A0A9Q8PHB4_PASFU|nr:uncharacterized protein CLAFUR5_12417 [Fulvia fulva]KAK4616161.1 hypothetical protein CLAFUR4_09828 [Fulvia fulva]KAK4616598.1 hypothetical protein CLAFUR0_09821 [Fulvia fulva]UJO22649.1 hypothetical protein CLAFUR5_12417 [Fulvia fulva]WPV19301.1 hypothetical protein CLAFUW4_09822 [Fulvia fulva]WPV34378.1 hypothetical protein CLAFUW7_09825 [Fulvia fulva]
MQNSQRYYGTTIVRYAAVLLFNIARRRRRSYGSIAYITSGICVKSLGSTTLAEAHAIVFVQETTRIPIPKVIVVFTYMDRTYIVIERLRAENLSTAWCRLSPSSSGIILDQMRAIVHELRGVPTNRSNAVGNGPFSSITEFHRQLRNSLERSYDAQFSSDLTRLIDFHEQNWDPPLFTHGDLRASNILVQGDRIVGIIDLETAGWMPSYWEHRQEVSKFMDPDPCAVEMEVIRRKYFGDIS